MYLTDAIATAAAGASPRRRRFSRHDVQCRARIRIGGRQYAGYLHNISQGGAKLRTISLIRRPGAVILRLPDLPALHCRLRWTDSYNAGVEFELTFPQRELTQWLRSRSGTRQDTLGAIDDLAELEPLP